MWGTFYGKQINFCDLSHQHLSNILWYFEIILNRTPIINIHTELNNRFGGIRLPYHPMISFISEIDELVRLGYTTNEIDAPIIVEGQWVGCVKYN